MRGVLPLFEGAILSPPRAAGRGCYFLLVQKVTKNTLKGLRPLRILKSWD